LVLVPRQSFPFGIPAYLAIIGRSEGLIRATEDPLIGERLWGFSLANGNDMSYGPGAEGRL
jgi:hypothetical protein